MSLLALNVFVQEISRTLSRWTVTPPEGKINVTVERMCSEMHAKYGKDAKVALRISGRDYVSGQFRTVCFDKIRLKSVTYDLIGRLVVDDWHLNLKTRFLSSLYFSPKNTQHFITKYFH